ncbi:MAG: PDR/VanB family oxidoreductase [Steroidobacteraceae bacterium]
MRMQAETDILMQLRIARAWYAAQEIRSFELVKQDGSKLPPFTPGSHVKVRVPNGELRKYSLCNDPADRGRYVIAVKRETGGRGGSISLVDGAQEGDILPTSFPDNAFALADAAAGNLFIAGGIGITPIMAMIHSLGERPAVPWTLHYCTRSPEATAFLQELTAPGLTGQVHIHHDYGDPARSFDLWPVLERPTGAHLYCCGPRGLMEAVRDMSGHWQHSHVHFESFNEGGGVRAHDQPFVVKLARSGRAFEIPVGETILGVLRETGLRLASSCESGTCGTCRTTLISGAADHRDMVLMPHEMADQIMICVSRARSPELVLDL